MLYFHWIRVRICLHLSSHGFGPLSLVRDFPCTVPLREFAKSLNVSMDTAKRHFVAGVFQYCPVKSMKTPSGRWRVILKVPDSTELCILAVEYWRLRVRKPILRCSLPLRISSEGAPSSLNEINKYLRRERKEDRMRRFPLDPAARGQTVATVFMLWAATELTKSSQRVTAKSLAARMQMSVASLYRAPFGAGLIRTIQRKVDWAGSRSELSTPMGRAEVHLHGLAPRKKDVRSYADRRQDKQRRRTKLGDSLLYWKSLRQPDGRVGMSLWFVLCSSIPRLIKKQFTTPTQIALWVAEQHPGIASTPVGAIKPSSVDGQYNWHTRFGWLSRGITATLAEAKSAVIEQIQPTRYLRKITILNPKVNEVPAADDDSDDE
jgi:hypothetical protein